MAVGRLGASNPAANTNTLIYTVPAGIISSLNVNVVNMGITDSNFTLYISDGSTTTVDRLVENSVVIPANGGVLERGAIVCTSGETLYVNAGTANLSIRVHGFED